jgi:hypothetical protein
MDLRKTSCENRSWNWFRTVRIWYQNLIHWTALSFIFPSVTSTPDNCHTRGFELSLPMTKKQTSDILLKEQSSSDLTKLKPVYFHRTSFFQAMKMELYFAIIWLNAQDFITFTELKKFRILQMCIPVRSQVHIKILKRKGLQ